MLSSRSIILLAALTSAAHGSRNVEVQLHEDASNQIAKDDAALKVISETVTLLSSADDNKDPMANMQAEDPKDDDEDLRKNLIGHIPSPDTNWATSFGKISLSNEEKWDMEYNVGEHLMNSTYVQQITKEFATRIGTLFLTIAKDRVLCDALYTEKVPYQYKLIKKGPLPTFLPSETNDCDNPSNVANDLLKMAMSNMKDRCSGIAGYVGEENLHSVFLDGLPGDLEYTANIREVFGSIYCLTKDSYYVTAEHRATLEDGSIEVQEKVVRPKRWFHWLLMLVECHYTGRSCEDPVADTQQFNVEPGQAGQEINLGQLADRSAMWEDHTGMEQRLPPLRQFWHLTFFPAPNSWVLYSFPSDKLHYGFDAVRSWACDKVSDWQKSKIKSLTQRSLEKVPLSEYEKTESPFDKWMPGGSCTSLNLHDKRNPVKALHDRTNWRLVAGASGTTRDILQLGRILNIHGEGLCKLRLAMMAWMLPGMDHSLIEIFLGAEPLMDGDRELDSMTSLLPKITSVISTADESTPAAKGIAVAELLEAEMLATVT